MQMRVDTLSPTSSVTLKIVNDLMPLLEKSLRYLLLELGKTGVDPVKLRSRLTQVFSEGKHVNATIFALHGVLRKAIEADDRDAIANAVNLFLDFDLETIPPVPLRIHEFSSSGLGAAEFEVLQTVYSDDTGLTSRLVAPDLAAFETTKELITRARALAEKYAEAWAHEFDVLVSDIYLATNADPSLSGFGGASVFDAFGSLLVNPSAQHNLATTFMTLIHESSHSKLFLYHLDDAVVLNGSDEMYTSPLRKAPRPMEGIFHAAWVSARMISAANEVLANGFTGPDADELAGMIPHTRATFSSCVEIIDLHGRLTDFGSQIILDAKRAALNA